MQPDLDCVERETCEDVCSPGNASTRRVHCAFRKAWPHPGQCNTQTAKCQTWLVCALGSISRSDRQWRQPGTRPSLSKFCRWTKRQRKVSVRSHQTGELQGSMVRSQSRKLTAVLKRGCWVEGIQPAVEIVNQKWNVLPGGLAMCAESRTANGRRVGLTRVAEPAAQGPMLHFRRSHEM